MIIDKLLWEWDDYWRVTLNHTGGEVLTYLSDTTSERKKSSPNTTSKKLTIESTHINLPYQFMLRVSLNGNIVTLCWWIYPIRIH